jgi:hypothetical protein
MLSPVRTAGILLWLCLLTGCAALNGSGGGESGTGCPTCGGAAPCCAPRICRSSTCCVPNGQSCSLGACCGVCNAAGACASRCAEDGDPCDVMADCCQGSYCPSGGGACAACKGRGDACSDSIECCGGRCKPGNGRCM